MIRRLVLVAGTTLLLSAAPAAAAPNPAQPPQSSGGIGTACGSIETHNPNASSLGHQSEQGSDNFTNVGQTMCGQV